MNYADLLAASVIWVTILAVVGFVTVALARKDSSENVEEA